MGFNTSFMDGWATRDHAFLWILAVVTVVWHMMWEKCYFIMVLCRKEGHTGQCVYIQANARKPNVNIVVRLLVWSLHTVSILRTSCWGGHTGNKACSLQYLDCIYLQCESILYDITTVVPVLYVVCRLHIILYSSLIVIHVTVYGRGENQIWDSWS